VARAVRISFSAAATTAVCTGQTLGGAGAFVIDGTLLDKSATMVDVRRAVFDGGVTRTVSLTSTGNISGVNFTIVGRDADGNAVTETRAGPNNNTVYTSALYNSVTSVTANGAVATATSVGSGTTGYTRWVKTNRQQSGGAFAATVGVTVTTGTINYTVQYTLDDVDTNASPTAISHEQASLVGATTTAVGNYAFPPAATRCLVNSSTDGVLTFQYLQAGV